MQTGSSRGGAENAEEWEPDPRKTFEIVGLLSVASAPPRALPLERRKDDELRSVLFSKTPR
jgi:hypothetical protein